jgi:membrane protein
MAAVIDRIPEWRVGQVDVTGLGKETVKEVMADDVMGLAAQMSYHAILAMFPFLILVAGITSLVDQVFGLHISASITDQTAGVLPSDVQSVLRRFTDQLSVSRGSWFAIGFGLAGSLYTASSAVKSAIKSLNRAYDVKSRSFVPANAVAVALTIGFALLMLGATLLLGSGAWLAGGVGSLVGWGGAFTALWNILAPLLAIIFVVAAASLLYWLGPNTDIELRCVIPGAILFVTGWILFSIAFGFYIGSFGSYNKVYGSIGAVIVLLVWLYWTNTLLLIGGELNAVLQRRIDRESGRVPRARGDAAQPGRPG